MTEVKRKGRPCIGEERMSSVEAQRRYRTGIKENGGISFSGDLKDPALVAVLDEIQAKRELRSRKAAIEYVLTAALTGAG